MPREDNRVWEEERPLIVHLVPGVSERIRRLCKEFNIRIVFKSSPLSVHSLLTSKTPFLL